jgi:hypothetical protein
MSGYGTVLRFLTAGLFALTLLVPAEAVAQRTLTKDQVQRFLLTIPELQYIALREGLNLGAKAKDAKNPVGAVIEAMSRADLREEVAQTVARHGFGSVKDWMRVGRSIGQAYVHVAHGGGAGAAAAAKLDENRERVAAEVEKLGFLSDKQKRRLLEKYDEVSDDAGKEPPPENVAVVREMRPQIEDVMKLGTN